MSHEPPKPAADSADTPLIDPNDLSFGGFSDRDTMRFMRDYDHPPRAIWASLTEPAQLSVWLWPCKSFEAKPGGLCVFDLEGKTLAGRITEFEPLKVLGLFGRMRFELTERPGGCRLVFTLKRPPDGWSPMGLAGFHGWFGRLGRLLDGRSQAEADQWASDIWQSVFAHYEREIRLHVAGGGKVIYRLHFAANDPVLSPESTGQLDDLARLLAARGDLAVTIDGFGDDPCRFDESLALCQSRVDAAISWLTTAGVRRDRINIGFVLGNYHPLVERDTEAARAFNRRIELRPTY